MLTEAFVASKLCSEVQPHQKLTDLAPSRAQAPVEHLAFSPDPRCPPKLLFPQAHKRKNAARERGGDSNDIFRPGDPVKPRSRPTTSLDKELTKAAER